MKATNWEFENRAWLFGMVFAVAFPLYFFDHLNATQALAEWLAIRLKTDADLVTRILLAVGAILVAIAAWLRTWASAYLRADVVYAKDIKTTAIVADGPYRYVRNPLYLANVLMVMGIAAMMSRAGFFVAVVGMLVFCYRLIFREEAELLAAHGQSYGDYRKAVPRLLPSPWPRVPSAAGHARWANGFKAELWCWGFAAAVAGFAITLQQIVFFVILGVSLAGFFMQTNSEQKKKS
jgi:protein-S-isoprenylcysteine O-methyltransferase Ste14